MFAKKGLISFSVSLNKNDLDLVLLPTFIGSSISMLDSSYAAKFGLNSSF